MLVRRSSNALATGHVGDTAQYYYNQSLAWFGVALLSGDFRQVTSPNASLQPQ